MKFEGEKFGTVKSQPISSFYFWLTFWTAEWQWKFIIQRRLHCLCAGDSRCKVTYTVWYESVLNVDRVKANKIKWHRLETVTGNVVVFVYVVYAGLKFHFDMPINMVRGRACGCFNAPNYQYLIKNFSAVDGFQNFTLKILRVRAWWYAIASGHCFDSFSH